MVWAIGFAVLAVLLFLVTNLLSFMLGRQAGVAAEMIGTAFTPLLGPVFPFEDNDADCFLDIDGEDVQDDDELWDACDVCALTERCCTYQTHLSELAEG